MPAVVALAGVRVIDVPQGNVRYVSKDTNGNEYTTFRKEIGECAKQGAAHD